jgi:hypothetical protein
VGTLAASVSVEHLHLEERIALQARAMTERFF